MTNNSTLKQRITSILQHNKDDIPLVRSIIFEIHQGWQVFDELVITAGKNTVITGLSVTNRHKLKNGAKSFTDITIYLLNAIVRPFKHNLGWWNVLYRFIQ